MTNTSIYTIIATAVCGLCLTAPSGFSQGSLTPPGAPGPTMKTLQQIEPRTDVLTLSGNGNNLFVINQSGSYYLTTNITGVAGKNGISIQADNVTLDLNGFTLFGGVTNSQAGILVNGAHVALAIRNGVLRDWGGHGISAGNVETSEFDRLRVMSNGGVGIKLGNGNTVSRCIAAGNGADGIDTVSNCLLTACNVSGNVNGISTYDGCTLKDCVVSGNSTDGIIVGQDCNILGCIANSNAYFGIAASVSSTIIGCSAHVNEFGIGTANGCTIKDCTADTNDFGFYLSDSCTVKDCTAYLNSEDGCDTGNDCTVIGCTAAFNGLTGFSLQSECTINNCTASANNDFGIVVVYSCQVKDNTTASNSRYGGFSGGAGISTSQSGNRIEGNVSNSDSIGMSIFGTENFIIHNTVRAAGMYNYNIVSGNMVGAVVNALASGMIQGATGGSGLGTADPYANFSF
jgi:parallel beta-helix repeat protein